MKRLTAVQNFMGMAAIRLAPRGSALLDPTEYPPPYIGRTGSHGLRGFIGICASGESRAEGGEGRTKP